jgi:hemin uptake protein HemP
MKPNPPSAAPASTAGSDEKGLPHYQFAELSSGGQEVLIEHEGHTYRLRRTKNGKLILNK